MIPGDCSLLVEADKGVVGQAWDSGKSETADACYGTVEYLPAATVLTEAITASASLVLLMTSYGVCFQSAIASPSL